MPDRISTLVLIQPSFKKLIKLLIDPEFLAEDDVIQEPAKYTEVEELYGIRCSTAIGSYRPQQKLQTFFSTQWRVEMSNRIERTVVEKQYPTKKMTTKKTNPAQRITEDTPTDTKKTVVEKPEANRQVVTESDEEEDHLRKE